MGPRQQKLGRCGGGGRRLGSERSQKLTRDDQGLVKLVSLTVSFVAPTCASPISRGRTTPVCVFQPNECTGKRIKARLCLGVTHQF